MEKTRSHSKSISNIAFEEAREAVVKIKTLQPLLSSKEEETLSILMDKELMSHLKTSLNEAKNHQFEPLENILKG